MTYEDYGSQGIQQEGWTLEVQEEKRIKPRQYRKGTTGKNCESCGAAFEVTSRNRSKRYCDANCPDRQKVKRWLPCSRCMAAVGIGAKTAARLLGIVNDSNISRRWKTDGIKTSVPQGRVYWRGYAGRIKEQDRKLWARYYSAWMREEIKAHGKSKAYSDWGVIWVAHKMNEKSRARYHAMTPSQKKKHNSSRCKKIQRDYLRKWKRDKMKNDPVYRLVASMRARLSSICKNANMGGYEAMVGCAISELRAHLQSQFEPWMSWDNYGTKWHVDHIIPVASFDHSIRSERKACWHFSNLRPLCAKKNMRKGAKVTTNQLNLGLLCATR